MTQTAQQQMTPQAPTVTVTPIGVPNPISRRQAIWTIILFCAITMRRVIGVPLYGYFYHYTWLDWSLFGLLYVAVGWASRSATID